MSNGGTLNISREDAGEVRRVFIVRNGSNGEGSSLLDGSGWVASVPRVSSVANTSQNGGNDGVTVLAASNGDSESVISGMLRSGEEDVDVSSDIGAELQHVEEWFKTRSDSLSSLDFDSEMKPSEIDINDFFNIKSGLQFHVGGQDYGLVFKDTTDGGGTSNWSHSSQGGVMFPELGDSSGSGSGSRRNSFTKRLETIMQVDKGLFEELLLQDPNKKNSKNALTVDDKGLFEELLLPPGLQEELARQAQEILAGSSEKKNPSVMELDNNSVITAQPIDNTPLLQESINIPVSESSDELELMVRNIQPIKLMSPQEIENMAKRPLGFEETPIKAEAARRREVITPIEEEAFTFHPFGTSADDPNVLHSDMLASPNSEVDSKLSSILAMDASNDPLEINPSHTSAGDMLESLHNKTPPKFERSISPGTFLVKLEPRESSESNNRNSASPIISESATLVESAAFTSMPPPAFTNTSAFTNTATCMVNTIPLSSVTLMDVGSVLTPMTKTSPSLSSLIAVSSAGTSTFASSVTSPKSLLKMPASTGRTDIKKLPVGLVQVRLATPNTLNTFTSVPSATSIATASTTVSSQRPALFLRPVTAQNKQKTETLSKTNIVPGSPVAVATSKASGIPPVALAPVKVVNIQPQAQETPGKANVTMTVDKRANLTTVNIVSSNNEHTVFKINTSDLVRAVSSIREPHLEPLGLTPQQLLRSAHTANRLIQEVHQQNSGPKKIGSKETSTGLHNFEINQVVQEVHSPISRSQQPQVALLRQSIPASLQDSVAVQQVGNSTEQLVACTCFDWCDIGGSIPNLVTTIASGEAVTASTVAAATENITSATYVNLAFQKTQIKSSSPYTHMNIKIMVRVLILGLEIKGKFKSSEGVGVSLRPGAPPTMVPVPSVLDRLSAPSILPDLLNASATVISDSSQSTGQQIPTTSNAAPTEELISNNNVSVSEEVANKAMEELGIQLNSLESEPSPQGGRRWPCPIKTCNKHFPRLCSLKVHLLSHNGIRPYKCSYEKCDWAFYTWYKLKRHIETHLKRRDHVCTEPSCNRRFTTIYNLNSHLRLHQQPKSCICSIPECNIAFRTRRELEGHMKNHKDVAAPYKCSIDGCTKSYFTPNSLTSHQRSHHKEEELRCQWEGCNKIFNKPCRMKAHMRVHTGQRPFVCTYEGCTWSFQSASKLSRHQRKHTNDRKFTCAICQKSFLRSEHLKGHLLIHTGVRNFQCPIQDCGAKFTAKSSLYVHLKKHDGKTVKENNNKVTYHCPIDSCDRSYNSKFSLRQHMLKNHTILTTDSGQLDYMMDYYLNDKDLLVDQLLTNTSVSATIGNPTLNSSGPPDPTSDVVASTPTLLSSIELLNGDITGVHGSNPIIVMNAYGGGADFTDTECLLASSHTDPSSHGNGSQVVLGDSLDMADLTKESTIVGGDPTLLSGGSARTDVLGNILLSQRAKKRQQINMAKKIAGFETTQTVSIDGGFGDVVLSASAVTLSSAAHLQNVLLQDEVSGDLYQDALMGHDILSDPSGSHQSTINLRDLE
ncbi:unnamed protein product, partial [Meganyctiphanes norvegica]